MKAPEGLLTLLRQQHDEADADLRRRAAKWLRLYRHWRGLFSDQDEETERTGTTTVDVLDEFWSDLGATLAGEEVTLSDEQPRIFIRELFRHCETYMSRIDEAFTAPVRPFELVIPRIAVGAPPTVEEFRARKVALYGAGECLVDDYKVRGSREEQLRSFRDAVIFGTGFSYMRKVPGADPYPRAVIERFPPWMVLADPYAPMVQECRYVILKRRFTQQEAIALWPDSKDEIVEACATGAGQDNPEGLGNRPTAALRREVLVLEYWTKIDPTKLKDILPEEDAQDAGRPTLYKVCVLGTDQGPSESVLEAYPNPFRHREIPVQEYTLLKSPTEQSCHGIGVADWIEEDQVLINSYFNLMLLNVAFSTLQGGFYDSLYAEELEPQLMSGFRPGQWKAINTGGKDPRSVMYSVAEMYKNFGPQYRDILEELRKNAARTTGVTDMNQGLSTKTNTDTLGEVNALRAEGNVKFRFYISRLDPQVTRSLRLYANTFADSLATERAARGPFPLWYIDEQDMWWPVIPEAFDQPWEVKLNAGSAWVSDEAKAQNMLLLAKVAAEVGEPTTARAAIRTMAYLRQLDPDRFVPMGMQAPGLPAGIPGGPGAGTPRLALPQPGAYPPQAMPGGPPEPMPTFLAQNGGRP